MLNFRAWINKFVLEKKHMKFALIAAAGLAITAGANANQAFSAAGPFALAGGASANLFTSGGASFGTLGLFTFSFTYAEPVLDSSWASDMQITISDGINTATIGGYDAPGIAPVYGGSGSTAPGVYSDKIDLSAFGITGGNLTVDISNDWGGDPNPNTVSGFSATLGGIVPTPGAMGLFGIAGLAAIRRRR
jgi:MYXO-CTERM domain-containing protein